MLQLLADENFNGDIVRGLLIQRPNLDLERVQDVGLRRASDKVILEWAAANHRQVLSHDCATMATVAYDRIIACESMPGVFLLSDRFPVGQAIREILLISECSDPSDWDGKVVYLPL